MHLKARSTRCVMLSGSPTPNSLVRAIVNLSRGRENEIGFFPPAALHQALRRGRLQYLVEDAELTGFVLWGGSTEWLRVHQILIRNDLAQTTRATALIQAAVTKHSAEGLKGILLRCADDLPSQLFWAALGFRPIGITHHDPYTTRNLIIQARVPICPPEGPLTSVAWLRYLATGSAVISATSPFTPRESERSFGILERRRLIRQVSHNAGAAIDSLWPSSAGKRFHQLIDTLGKPLLRSSVSSLPDLTSGFISHSTSTSRLGRRPSLLRAPHYFPRR